MNQGIIRPYESHFELIQRMVDGLIIVAVLGLSVAVYSKTWTDKYTIAAISAIILFTFSGRINHLYQSYRVGGLLEEFKPLVLSWLGTVAGLLVMGYALKVTQDLSRVTIGLWILSTPLVLLIWRAVLRHSLKTFRAKGFNTRSVVIVGTGKNAQRLAKNIIGRPQAGLKLLGFISNDRSGELIQQQGETWSVLGDLDHLLTMAHTNQVDKVYIAMSITERAVIDTIMVGLGNTTASIYIVPDYYEADLMQGKWASVGDSPTISVIDDPNEGIDSWIKRSEDIIVSSVALILHAIPMACIALGIKLTSRGPVFFKQPRYGLGGKPILVWKFRTMSVMETGEDFVQAQRNDQRITRFGAFLRKTSLDELPQLINVLGGSMSIVGPRPHAVAHNEEFRGRVAGYMLRHKVKPGITGLAQIYGFRGETETDDKMRDRVHYDVEYIQNWSIWQDIAIILKTPWALLRGSNAY